MSPTMVSSACMAAAAVLISAIAAMLVYAVARLALAKARPADVPQVLVGLAQLLGRLSTVKPEQQHNAHIGPRGEDNGAVASQSDEEQP